MATWPICNVALGCRNITMPSNFKPGLLRTMRCGAALLHIVLGCHAVVSWARVINPSTSIHAIVNDDAQALTAHKQHSPPVRQCFPWSLAHSIAREDFEYVDPETYEKKQATKGRPSVCLFVSGAHSMRLAWSCCAHAPWPIAQHAMQYARGLTYACMHAAWHGANTNSCAPTCL